MSNIKYCLNKEITNAPTKGHAFLFNYDNSIAGKLNLLREQAVLQIVNETEPIEQLKSGTAINTLRQLRPMLLGLYEEVLDLKEDRSSAMMFMPGNYEKSFQNHEERMKNLIIEIDKNGFPPSKELADFLIESQGKRLEDKTYTNIEQGLKFSPVYPLNIAYSWLKLLVNAAKELGYVVEDNVVLNEIPILRK